MIKANDFQRQAIDTRREVVNAVSAVLESGWYILGSEVESFEVSLAANWGVGYAIGVASGLDAIEIGLRILGCRAGDRVLTTPLSAFATTLAIVKLGAVPVFVDTDEHGLIDLEKCRDHLRRNRDVRFLVPVHLYGHCLDMNALRDIKEEFSLFILEDCAQSISAHRGGVGCGTVGQIAATSFYPTKNLGAIGDGGAILTSDPSYAQSARAYRDYGQSAKYRHDVIGWNSRLDELQAALLHRVFLPRLPNWTLRRRQIAQAYLDGIRHPGIRCVDAPPGSASVWHLFPVVVDAGKKANFLQHLRSAEIGAGEHYPILIPHQQAMQGVAHQTHRELRNAMRFSGGEVSLPIHPYLLDEEVAFVISRSNQWSG